MGEGVRATEMVVSRERGVSRETGCYENVHVLESE